MLSIAKAVAKEPSRIEWKGYSPALMVTAISTAVGAVLVQHIALTNIAMVYLLGVAYVATRAKPGAAILASLLGVVAFDFCFVPPQWTLAVAHVEYVFTFAVMLVVGILISTLTAQLKERAKESDEAVIRAEVEAMRGDLLSSVSHDLRTPLSAIEGSADALLRQHGLNDQVRSLATNIQEESGRMSQLIGNLLDMTRVAGKVDLDIDWHSLEDIAANAISRTEGQLASPITLTVDPKSKLVRVDGVLMEQAFVNILENAARHAGRNALIELRIEQDCDSVRIAFVDNGPGLPQGIEDKIFERFQGGPSKGVGLGLAICRAIVEAHGGMISASNSEDGGARFVVTLPLSLAEDEK